MTISQLANSIYRAKNPTARNPKQIKIGHNTAARKSYRCALCGAESPTCSAKWPVTVRVRSWVAEHESGPCAERYAARHLGTASALSGLATAYRPDSVPVW